MAIPDGFWTANLEATKDRMNQNLIQFDTAANRPVAGTKGLFFTATDTKVLSYDNGSAWVTLGTLTEMTQAEAEAGTDTDFQFVSALRIKQAVDALAGAAPVFGRVKRTAGDVTTTSTSLVDFTGATVTFTTGAFPVAYGVEQNGRNDIATAIFSNIDIDASLELGAKGFRVNCDVTGNDRNLSFTGQSVALTAASHTVKLQWFVSSATGAVNADSNNAHLFWSHEVR